MAPVSDRSFCRYWEITSRCSKADCMFVVADFSWEERLKPILNPKRISHCKHSVQMHGLGVQPGLLTTYLLAMEWISC